MARVSTDTLCIRSRERGFAGLPTPDLLESGPWEHRDPTRCVSAAPSPPNDMHVLPHTWTHMHETCTYMHTRIYRHTRRAHTNHRHRYARRRIHITPAPPAGVLYTSLSQ